MGALSRMNYKGSSLLYASGELTGQEAAEFERHLRRCADCRGRLAAAKLVHDLSPATLEHPSATLVEGALAGVRARAARPGRSAKPWGLGLILGLACLAAVFVLVRRAPPVPAPVVPAPGPSEDLPQARPSPRRAPVARHRLAAKDLTTAFRLARSKEDAARIRFASFSPISPGIPPFVLKQPARLGGFSALRR